MRLLASVFAALLFTGCAAHGGSVIPQVPTAAVSTASDSAKASQYVYVVNRGGAVSVYPENSANPIRTFNVTSADSVAVDSKGQVYVSDWSDQVIDVYNSGGTALVRTINISGSPNTVSVDENDNVIVSTDDAIYEYHQGAANPYATIDADGGYVIYSAVTDREGNLYAEMYQSPYNFVFEYVHGAWSRLPISGGGPASIVFNARGRLGVAAIRTYMTFNPPSPKFETLRSFDSGTSIWHLSKGRDGSMYLPVSGPSPFVFVIPSTKVNAPHKITNGVTNPIAAAEG